MMMEQKHPLHVEEVHLGERMCSHCGVKYHSAELISGLPSGGT